MSTLRTWADARQYAQDRLQDGTGAKSSRQIARVVKRALKRIAKARLWSWYLRRHRLTIRPPVSWDGLSVAALGISVLNDGTPAYSTLLRDASLIFSGKTELMGVQSVVNSTELLLWSSEPYVGASVGAAFSGSGSFVFERIPLPADFRANYSEPHQSNYLAGLTRISQDEMNTLKRVWDNAASEPIYYVIIHNRRAVGGPRWELWLWPPASTLKTIDFIAYWWPDDPESAGEIDWDPNQDDLMDRAMDIEAAIELEHDKKYARTEAAFRRALKEAKAAERTDVGGPPAGQVAYRGTKAYRSDHFLDAP